MNGRRSPTPPTVGGPDAGAAAWRRAIVGTLAAIIVGGAPSPAGAGPYSPAAGQPGSTAIDNNDPRIVAWATGWRDYDPGPGVDAVWQTPEEALGPAEGDDNGDPVCIVSLGRRGMITLTFNQPVIDGPGPDFAIFENSFSDRFLELAFVEASDDGIGFRRFASDSLTTGPVAGFDINGVDPTDVDGLAGKFRAGFGVPFDLADLGLARAVCIRIVDVVGDGGDLDSGGAPIYDPFPTEGSAGFDLDGVAVLHQGDGAVDTFAAWRVGAFPADVSADDAVSGPMADPDRDGSLNLAEYAAGTDPRDGGEGFRIGAAAVGGSAIECVFNRMGGRRDVRLVLEASADGIAWGEVAAAAGDDGWTSGHPGVSIVEMRPAGNGGSVVVRATVPAAGGTRLFRVRCEFLPLR